MKQTLITFKNERGNNKMENKKRKRKGKHWRILSKTPYLSRN